MPNEGMGSFPKKGPFHVHLVVQTGLAEAVQLAFSLAKSAEKAVDYFLVSLSAA